MQRGLRGPGRPRPRSRGFPRKRPPAAPSPASGSTGRAPLAGGGGRSAPGQEQHNAPPPQQVAPLPTPRGLRAGSRLRRPPARRGSGPPRPRLAAPALLSGAPRQRSPHPRRQPPALSSHLVTWGSAPPRTGREGTRPRGRVLSRGALRSSWGRAVSRVVPPTPPPPQRGRRRCGTAPLLLAAPPGTRRRARRRRLTAPQYGGVRRRSDFSPPTPPSDVAPAPALSMRGADGHAPQAARSRCP
ncbi:proline-rich protein 2-like [Chroicocephalus ridibundus]|uniref:proline-rich protein 2-like n=1 Tax=Chroicocephalus ridibundus TaxID=1192867 RepID=UPI002FDCD447